MNLYLFPGFLQNPMVEGLLRFQSETVGAALDGYYQASRELLRHCGSFFTRHSVKEYCIRLLLDDACAAGLLASGAKADDYLLADLEQLAGLIAYDWDGLCEKYSVLPFPVGAGAASESDYSVRIQKMVDASSPHDLAQRIAAFFTCYGDSQEAKYAAFRWKGWNMEGIHSPDRITFEQLGGLEFQKKTLMDNTRSFLNGAPANDILLVGGSGTGKSSCVKATLSHFAKEGLKLVEVPKEEVGGLPKLMEVLAKKKRKYIVFIDDLSFENPDVSYMALKVALDGQIQQRPAHMLIYATSNRRHLIRETWSDRDSEQDIHENDTLHEKMSLSERFGIHLYFSILSQKEYFDIIALLLAQHNVPFTDEVGRLAAAWAITYNGRSGRTAKQFVVGYLARRNSRGVRQAEDI